MPSLNNVQLIGWTGTDPETRILPSGRIVTMFSLATERRWTDIHGEKKEATEWHFIECWGRLGEICQKYVHKARLVYLEGRIQTDRWQDEAGDPHTRTKIVARQMQLLDRKPPEPEEPQVGFSEDEDDAPL